MNINLYDYQEVALYKVIEALRKYGRALMVMATSLGKTITSSQVIDYFLSLNLSKKQRILFLCHDTGILEQCFKKYQMYLGENYTYARFYGQKKNWNADKHNFVFATFQSKPHKFFKSTHFDYIIVDEGHHSKAETYDEVLDFFTPKWELAMTATPDREDGKDIRDRFGDPVVDYPLAQAIANEWVTPIEYKVMSDGIDKEKLQELVNGVLVEEIKINEKQLNDWIFVRSRTEVQCREILNYTDQNLKAIVFCNNIMHLEHVQANLPRSVIVHSGQSAKMNALAIAQYEAGIARHILVVDKFNEGIDLPDTDVLVFLRSTNSFRIWAQQLGRGLRKYLNKKKVIVLDFVANIERIRDVRQLISDIASYKEVQQTEFDETRINAPLHIEGSGFMFDFDEQLVSVLSMLDYMEKQDATKPSMELLVEELKQKGIVDHWTLTQFGVGNFHSATYGRFGKGYALLSYALGEKANVSYESIFKLSEKLGWTPTLEDKRKKYKAELAKHGIIDYWTLITQKAIHFSKLSFGEFGNASDFCFFVFGIRLSDMNVNLNDVSVLQKLADKLGWTPSEEERKDKFKAVLAEQGITDYWSFNRFTFSRFNKTEWGIFGKGKSFAGIFFSEFVESRIFDQKSFIILIDKLGWTLSEYQKIDAYRAEFAKHGIVDYWSLVKNPYNSSIRKADFGLFGKGFSFCSTILSVTADQFPSDKILIEVAKKLGWFPEEKEILIQEEERWKVELAKNGITDYWTLMLKQRFDKLSFGEYGKATGFLASIFPEHSRSFTAETRELLAEKLRWTPTEEEKIQRYKEELLKHNIKSYLDLVSLGSPGFTKLQFGIFNGGASFFSFIMNSQIKNLQSLEALAEKLGWEFRKDERLTAYRESLAKNNISDYWDMLVISVDKFRTMDFGEFGKGTSFCCHVLGRNIASVSRVQRLEVAEALGWTPTEEEKIVKYREELKKNGIHSRSDLFSMRTDHFTKLEFGVFGKGRPFINYVLGDVVGVGSSITRQVLNDLSDTLWPQKN